MSNTAMGVSCMSTLGDYHGEQTVWILSSSNSNEVDTFAEASWTNDSEAESVYAVNLAAWIGQGTGNNTVKSGNTDSYNNTTVSLSTSTNVGSQYSSNGQLSICFGTPQGEGPGGGGDPCAVEGPGNGDDPGCGNSDCYLYGLNCVESEALPASPNLVFPGSGGINSACSGVPGAKVEVYAAISVSISTNVPRIDPPSKSSGAVGASNQTMTITGSYLIDDFGIDGVQFSNSGIHGTVNQGATASQVTVTYSIDPNATMGAGTVLIANSFGNSNTQPFAVGYPPASDVLVAPPVWPANTTGLPVTITGNNFGTNPIVTIVAQGVPWIPTAFPSTNNGTMIQFPVDVMTNAPNGPVTVAITPGYAGSGLICVGGCSSGSSGANGTAASGAVVQAATPPTPIINLLNGTTASPYAGQPISVSISAPTGWTLNSQSWSFGSPADVVANFIASTSCGAFAPVSSTADTICGTAVPAFSQTQTSLPIYFYIIPGSPEVLTVNVTYALADGSASAQVSASQTFNVQGPSGNTTPTVKLQTDISGLKLDTPTAFTTEMHMSNAPTYNSNGIWFSETQPSRGNILWIQVLNSVLFNQIQSPSSSYIPPTNVTMDELDGFYPYPSISSNTTGDSPGRKLYSGFFGEGDEAFQATMYVLWDPAIPKNGQGSCSPAATDSFYNSTPSDCASIPVPLASIPWKWYACAVNSLGAPIPPSVAPSPSWIRQCGSAQASPTPSATYPKWNSCYASKNGHC